MPIHPSLAAEALPPPRPAPSHVPVSQPSIADSGSLCVKARGTPGSPRFPLKGSFKGDVDVGIDIDVDIDIDLDARGT